MADYKELLRRAVEALPENNGAARRAVYEKARAALVGQLRAINPPLPARDITTHRLQLEDCIRQVEQEASEAVIAGMTNGHDPVPPPPVYFEPPPAAAKQLAGPGRGSAKPQLRTEPEPQSTAARAGASIEDIIAAADRDAREQTAPRARSEARPEPKAMARPIQLRSLAKEPEPDITEAEEPEDEVVEPSAPPAQRGGRPVPAIVARAEAAKNRGSVAFGLPQDKPYEGGRRGPTLEARRDPAPQRSPQLSARATEPAPRKGAAMSAVREVDVEGDEREADPQGLIDRAMATLDREARGDAPGPKRNGMLLPPPEPVDEDEIAGVEEAAPEALPSRSPLAGLMAEPRPVPTGKSRGLSALKPDRWEDDESEAEPAPAPFRKKPRARAEERPLRSRRGADATAPAGFPRARAEDEGGGISAVTIFLIIFVVLLLGAGGAGAWAWNEGYFKLDSMFGGQPGAQVADTTPTAAATTPAGNADESAVPQSGPGNTTLAAAAPTAVPELKPDARLTADPQPQPVPESPALALAPTPAEDQQRLSSDPAAAAIGAATGDAAGLNPDGSQSLLLEASDDGRTGAVPFSGTIEWSEGKDETGLPTIVGKASIPARNLGVDILIRKNVDSTLPASHLMEINFKVSDSFIGGSVAGVPGVLLKDAELTQGQPLVGASARVVGNSFLFALSAAPEDQKANGDLLTSRKWMDLALIYATGKRAIITLEKDKAAEGLFSTVFTRWQTASAQ